MISDDDDYYIFGHDFYTDSEPDWYDDDDDLDYEDYGIHCGYGYADSDNMDYETYRPQEQSEQQLICKELNIQNPDDLPKNPLTLLDICASKIALNFPFAFIENRHPPIPENVQLRIISFSFPQHMEKIKQYCSLSNGSSGEFDKAIKILKTVTDLTQIGFHLSANVDSRGYREVWYGGPPGKKTPPLYVNVKFDRGKITDTNCPCEHSSSWCSHVIAVCLSRIFLRDKCVIKPPFSDLLNNLTTYAELRTFTQYLIAEFSDRRILNAGLDVLNRMKKPPDTDEDAINETWGAPDPTAGPGLDEPAHWLVCEEGLKSRCLLIIRGSDLSEGSWGTNISHSDALTASVWEKWRATQIEKPIVEEYFNNLDSIPGSITYSYNNFRKSYVREKSKEITKFLKTCEELLKDDFGFSLKAVQTFTVQLMDTIEEKNKRSYYIVNEDIYERNYHLGCLPKPQECWLFRDQLARLWRLLVLNPSISAKEREEIFTSLEGLEAKLLGSSQTKKNHFEWDSPKHIQYLKTFTWDSLHLSEDPFKDDDKLEISVLKSTVIEANIKRSTKELIHDPSQQFPYPIELTCGEFSSSVTVYCYIIEALSVYGKKEQAVHLAMNLALAIVRYYSAWLEGNLHVDIQDILSMEHEEKQENESGKKGKGGKNKKRQNRKRGRAGSKKNEGDKEKSNEMLFDQIKGVIPITCIAYLIDLLDQNEELLAEMLKLVKLRGLGLCEEELMECDDVTSDAKSLIFRLGVFGLSMPKIQTPSLQIQIEWFNWEVYVSQKLMQSTPSAGDVEFLKMFSARMMDLCESGFHPPHALVMNLFQHSYKPDAKEFEDGIGAAIRAIVVSPWKPNGVGVHRRTLLECLRRHWVKLCEVVLCRVSENAPHLSHVLECLFTVTNMIGTTCEDVNIRMTRSNKMFSENATNSDRKQPNLSRNQKLIQSMLIEKVVANIYLAYVLVAKANSLTPEPTESDKQSSPKKKTASPSTRRYIIHQRHVLKTDEEKKAKPTLTERQNRLYETAITLASRAFAVKNFKCNPLERHDYDYNFVEFMGQSLKWMCNISQKIGVKAFDLILERQRLHSGPVKCFNDDELIKMCSTMLDSEQKREERVWLKVRGALLTLLRPQSDTKISEILSLCRNVEKEPTSKRVLLVPTVCKELLLYIPGCSLEANTKVEQLSRAMVIMQSLCKKLENEEDSGENLEGIKELFSENSKEKASTSEEINKQENIDPNLQLCFDLATETVKHTPDNHHRLRNFETRRTFENVCDIVTYVARRARQQTSDQQSVATVRNAKDRDKTEPFEEVYVNRFIEVLCTSVKDYLLLTDFFFELSSRLLALPHRGSFGRDRVLLSDDIKVGTFCQTCSCLSVLLKRCIAGLVETTKGEEMDKFIKESPNENPGYYKGRVKNATFYRGHTLLSFLEVLKRLMSISQDDDFEPFSYKLASRHPVTRTAIDELNNKGNSSPSEESTMSERRLTASHLLMLRGMLGSTFFDLDDTWMY